MRPWRIMLVILVGVAALVALLSSEWASGIWQVLNTNSISQVAAYLRSFGIWTPLISICLMVFQAVIAPLPGSVVAAANGIVFGVGWGGLLSWSGGVLGATASFWLARWLGQDAAARLAGRRFQNRRNPLNEPYGFWIILMIRLLPVVSFDFMSYLAGLSRISYKHFILATALGMIPGTYVWTAFGHGLVYDPSSLWRISLLAIIAVSGYLVIRRRLGRQTTFDLQAELRALSEEEKTA